MNELLAAYRYIADRWTQIEVSKQCVCGNCVKVFRPEEIVGWTGLTMENMNNSAAVAQQMAMCSSYGCGFAINANFLARVNEA